MPSDPLVPVTSQVPYWLYQKIKEEAEARNLSNSALIREILSRYFQSSCPVCGCGAEKKYDAYFDEYFCEKCGKRE